VLLVLLIERTGQQKNLDPMSLSATTMKASLFCCSVNVSDTGDQISVFGYVHKMGNVGSRQA